MISQFRDIKTGAASSPRSHIEGGSGIMPGMTDSVMSGDTEDPVQVVTLSVQEVMNDEWELMRSENSDLPPLSYRKRKVPLMDTMDLGMPKWKSSCLSSPHYSDDEFEVST